jgi:hypothetical protein
MLFVTHLLQTREWYIDVRLGASGSEAASLGGLPISQLKKHTDRHFRNTENY